MMALKCSPDSSRPTRSTKSNPILEFVFGEIMRISHVSLVPSTATAYAVPSPSFLHLTISLGLCRLQDIIRCAMVSRSTENAERSNCRSGAGRVCHGHQTVRNAARQAIIAQIAETQDAGSFDIDQAIHLKKSITSISSHMTRLNEDSSLEHVS